MAKKLFISGASGNVGKASIEALATYSGEFDVVAGVRNPAKPEAAALSSISSNVTVVAADTLKPDFHTSLEGVDYVYIITPGSSNRTEVAVGAIEASKKAGVKFILLISVFTTPLTDTIFGRQFTPIEKSLQESGLNYSILRLPFFIENNFGQLETIKGHGGIYGPIIPDKPLTSVSVRDVGAVAAKILSNPEPHYGKTYKLSSPLYTQADLAKAFSDALGKPVTYTQVPFEATKEALLQAGFEEWQVDGINELNKLVNEQDPVYVDASSLGVIESILGRPAITIEAWTKAVAPAFQ